MTDRPVRLGDVIDDYCLRCRLLLNHDVASLMGADVAKVTCRTCHNTHDYRKGDVPKRKARKDDKKQLMDQVLATLAGRTVQQALDDGDDLKVVWRAVCEAVQAPASER